MKKFAIICDGKIGEHICLDSDSDIITYVNVDRYPQPAGTITGFDPVKKKWISQDAAELIALQLSDPITKTSAEEVPIETTKKKPK